jgi:hypothetical protein
MSYARNNGVDSDVYIVKVSDVFMCYHGRDSSFDWGYFTCVTRRELWDHLLDHLEVGDMVPSRVWTRLSMEMENETNA